MDTALLILLTLVLMAIVTAFWKGGWQLVITGFKQAGRTFKSVWLRLLLGFTLGGLIPVLLPSELIAEWLGPVSGLKGILIGSYIAIIISSAPHVTMPIIASIYRAGAGVGPIIALLAGRMLGVRPLITWEFPFLGVKISLSRYIVALFIPPFVGLVGAAVYQLLNLT
ncbi:permease [Chloroflexota bacterium]